MATVNDIAQVLATGLGDGMTIDSIDAFGVLLSAVRGLASQVAELQDAAA